MKKKVGLLLAIIMVMSLFTACGQTDGLDAAGNPTGSEVHSDSEWPHSYVDALGNEVTLEEPPQRVVSTFHAMYHDYMLALDVYPVGVAAADTFLTKWDAFDAYLNGHEVADVGATTAINLEMLLELEPDLIIGLTSQEDQYEAFSKIAPTILLDNEAINLDWKYGLEEFEESPSCIYSGWSISLCWMHRLPHLLSAMHWDRPRRLQARKCMHRTLMGWKSQIWEARGILTLRQL